MKRDLISRLVFGLAFSGLVLGSCGASKDDGGTEVPPSPEKPAVTGEYGLDPQAVKDFFASAVKGVDASWTKEGELAPDQIAGASDYVWGLWKTALEMNVPEKLPALSSHQSLKDWGDIYKSDAMWSLPEGGMSIFYGSKGEKPASGYPLFLFLHGSGSDAGEEWRTSLSWAQYFKEGSSVYFVPKSPQGGTGCRWYQPSRQAKWEQLLKQALVSDDINHDKIYFMGISEGAYGTQRLASFYADYLAGAGPIAGGELLASCPPENLANIAYCHQTGELDTSYGRDRLTKKVGGILDGLQNAHPGLYIHKVNLQPGKDHGCDYTVTNPWLVNYSRNILFPKYVYWENYGLGGINGEPLRYRDSFYNLYIVKPSDDRTDDLYRTVYEMDIDGNTIDLTVRNVTLRLSEPVSIYGWDANLGVEKTYSPATTGKVRIYLNSDLVDLSKPVTVKVNGVEKFNGTVEPDTRNLVESCAIFYDPARIFPASVEVSVD